MEKAFELYKEALKAVREAEQRKETAVNALRHDRADLRDRQAWETLKLLAAEQDAAFKAYDRAVRIKHAAAYIAEQKVKAAAVPIVTEVLKKYAGKKAGPKTREKAAAEIAAAVGARSAWFNSRFDCQSDMITFHFDTGRYDIEPHLYCAGSEYMIDKSNVFQAVTIPDVKTDTLPDDLEKWADDFDKAAAEQEEAKAAFEAATQAARRVNLGKATVTYYYVHRSN